MSASLVGSEMCIRDSMQETCRRHAGDMQETCERHAGDMQETCRRHAGAVSYTHLTLPTICSV
eukprot:3566116-Alexandrium_andersonii.AAC.1